MIYPSNFEQKIGFTDIRRLLRGNCLSTLGSEMVDKISFSADVETVNEWLRQTREFRQLQEEDEDFPLQYFFDMRVSVARIRLENTHLEENELFDLYRSLMTINDIVKFLKERQRLATSLMQTMKERIQTSQSILRCSGLQKEYAPSLP